MAPPAYNLKNPAVKRILQEIKEVQADISGDFMAEALETDIFEWHFAIRGPPDTEFEGGIYHGRILLPAEYPFKPPAFMMLTPSGRFETGVKICLSISTHHPEQWQPSWSVRTALTALIAFMPSPAGGALGALDYTADERRKLAAKSQVEPPKWGSPERQQIIADMHARMLAAAPKKAPTAPPADASPATAAAAAAGACITATEIVQAGAASAAAQHQPQEQQQQQQAGGSATAAAESREPGGLVATLLAPSAAAAVASQLAAVQQAPAVISAATTVADGAAAPLPAVLSAPQPQSPACTTQPSGSPSAPSPSPAATAPPPAAASPVRVQPARRVTAPAAAPPDTWGLTVLAVLLGVLIAAILLRKALVAVGYQPPSLLTGAGTALDPEL